MKIAIIGTGNIGGIYARSFIKNSIVKEDELFLLEKVPEHRKEIPGKWMNWESPELKQAEIFILSVKPQDFSSIRENLRNILTPGKIVLSIMAGITISKLQEDLKHEKVVRAMPNAPIAFGLGMTGFCAWIDAELMELKNVENLLSCNGRTIFFQDEEKMNAVTALSGSGPAYFYYFVKAMTEAGKEMGFDEAVSALLVKQTMLGAFHLMNASGDSLDKLISTVASKGGTTEAALSVFNEFKIREGIIEGIKAAERRGEELSQ